MKPMRILALALLASGLFSVALFGGDAKSALKEFGLIGTWSADCSKDISQPRTNRLVFAAPSDGGAAATAQDNNGEAVITTVYEITDAARVESDKIRVAMHPVKVTSSDGKPATQHQYDNLSLVFQKVEQRIKVIRIHWEGLPEIDWASFFEKCPT